MDEAMTQQVELARFLVSQGQPKSPVTVPAGGLVELVREKGQNPIRAKDLPDHDLIMELAKRLAAKRT